jgi:hypothetical protein
LASRRIALLSLLSLLNQQYITDDKGNRTGVILPIGDYKKILEALETLESIRAFDEAKASEDEAVPFNQAIEEIEADRK